MATNAENIATAIAAITVELAANPTAVSYSIDGQSVTRGDLVAKLKALMEIQASLGGPIEVESLGY